jgi:hypothetical protein
MRQRQTAGLANAAPDRTNRPPRLRSGFWTACAVASASVGTNQAGISGESGIRYLEGLFGVFKLQILRCRTAKTAIFPADHCTLLHAGRPIQSDSQPGNSGLSSG